MEKEIDEAEKQEQDAEDLIIVGDVDMGAKLKKIAERKKKKLKEAADLRTKAMAQQSFNNKKKTYEKKKL